MRKPLWWIKLTNYEYWPTLVFYGPMIPYIIYLGIKARSLTFFTTCNPTEEFGSYFGDSKQRILEKVKSEYLPKNIFLRKEKDIGKVLDLINQNEISFPLIVKPDRGERGVNVELIQDEKALKLYHRSTPVDYLIQEYLNYPIELGIFFIRYPDKSKIDVPSIVAKEFLSVIGDGRSTIEELLKKKDRARFQIRRLTTKNPTYKSEILSKGKELLLEPIGNHNRGTMFIDRSDLVTTELVKAIDLATDNIKGFYYGRIDAKVLSYEKMYQGNGIKFLEINGVYAEPAHIYDPKHSLKFAYAEVKKYLDIIYEISVQNKKRGFQYVPFKKFIEVFKYNFFKNKSFS